uniref:CSON002297 protein n=1 Tax=Culicoides sonorensis TaxID=179676 RepID=A0A336L337_CULSO
MDWLRIFSVLLLTGFLCVNSTKLNYPRILTSSRLDLVQIKPIYEPGTTDCSFKAIVTTLSKEKRRNTAIVLAEDLSTGEVLRCDVILDLIHELGVLTTTRELYLEEAPETFELWAQDSQGNAFTTLEGIEFNWEISSQNYRSIDAKSTSSEDPSWKQVLRFLTFSQSKYHEVPKSVEKFENLGLRGYMVLLEGINTGTARVKVRLPYPEYAQVAEVTADIMVLANLLLDPLDVHILVGDQITFRVLQLKSNRLQEITLNNQYYLEIEDTKKATIDGKVVTGQSLGRTFVVLKDRNVPDEKLANTENKPPLPKASVTVVLPHKLELNLLPHYNWVTTESESHTIALDLYSKNDQKITLGPKYKFGYQFDKTLFGEKTVNLNASRIDGVALKEGMSPVKGTFDKYNLQATADLQIYSKLQLTPKLVILPFDPNSPQRQQIQFIATGGDGSYTWTTGNSQLLHISQTGLAEIYMENLKYSTSKTSNQGEVLALTSVTVALSRNTKIEKKADVVFIPPEKLEIVSYNFETAVGDYVVIHVAFYAKVNGTLTPYTACDNVHFDLNFSNNQIFNIDVEKVPEKYKKNACRQYFLKASSVGTTNFKVSHRFMDKELSDEVVLVTFDPLNILNPVTNEIVLPIGSSRNVFYHHGPRKVFNIEAELIKKVNYDHQLVDINEVIGEFAEDTKYIYNILCKKVGDQVITLNIFNALSSSAAVPYITKYETKVYCVKPRFLNLYTIEKLKAGCPLKRQNSQLHVRTTNDEMQIEIEVLDAHQRKLQNISSLIIDWHFTQGDGKSHTDQILFSRKSDVDLFDGVPIPKRDYLMTSINEIDVNFKIKGVVTQYDEAVLDHYAIWPEIPHFGIKKTPDSKPVTPLIENELNFLSVDKTLLPFSTLSIFLSTNVIKRIRLAQGSGYYDIKASPTGIVEVQFDETSRELVLIPRKIGETRISVLDRCLSTESSILTVSVVSIGRIEIQSPDRVEKTKSIEAIVKLFDTNDNLLTIDYDNLAMYHLREDVLDPNLLSLKLGNQVNLNEGEIRYVITGVELGETKIVMSSNLGAGENEGRRVSSAPAPIQVFPPLTLYPRNITMYVGTSVQIYSKGGPYPDVNVLYSVKQSEIASIDSTIVHALKLGHTKVTGRCIGINPINGHQIVYSEDFVNIHVIPFDGIKIRTPLVKIKSGAVMPATIFGLPDISPMVLGTLPSLDVFWSTDQPSVIDIKGVFNDIGVEYKERNAISVRIHALNPGKAQLHAVVLASNGLKFTANVEISVFKVLELEAPKHFVYDPILVPPMAGIQLKANLDDVVYMLDDQQNSSAIRVSRDGLVQSMEANGRSLVIASSQDQTLTIPIEVKNIHYIQISLYQPETRLKHIETNIPNGLNLALKISLHDNIGNEFAHNFEDLHALRYRLANKDLLDVHFGGNFTLKFKFLQESTNILGVALKDQSGIKYPEDYIKLSIGESPVLYPKKTGFSVGDVICFDSPLLDSTKWHSLDTKSVVIGSDNGLARIIGAGKSSKVTITHGNAGSGSYFEFGLNVKGLDKIEFLKRSDIFNGERYLGKIVLKHHLELEKYSNVFAKNMTQCLKNIQTINAGEFFKCHLTVKQGSVGNVLDYFSVTPIFDTKSGSYACSIDPIQLGRDLTDIIKSSEVHLELEARLSNGISDRTTLKIVPAISITPDIISVDQLEHKLITITGIDKVIQKVEVRSSHPNDLEVAFHSKTQHSVHYRARLLKPFMGDLDLNILINSPLTVQTIEIPVVSPNYIRKCASQPFTTIPNMLVSSMSSLGLVVTTIVLIGAVAWIFSYCFQSRQSNLNGAVFSPFQADHSRNGSTMHDKSINSSIMSSSTQSPYSPYGQSPYRTTGGHSQSSASNPEMSPVYGDTSLISPQKRSYRRLNRANELIMCKITVNIFENVTKQKVEMKIIIFLNDCLR